MKKTIKVVSSILSLLLVFVSGCGCVKHKGEDHMKRYMDSIELEFSGYYISHEQENDCMGIFEGIQQFPVETTIREKNIVITKIDGYKLGYILVIDEQEFEITVDYFKSHSEAFNKILKMWDEYEGIEENSQEIWIEYIFIYNDEIFICASKRKAMWIVDWRGQIPLTLYHFDIDDYSLKYAGYFDSYTFNGYICKNK